MKKILYSICFKLGVSPRELLACAACVILGSAYLVYTYCIIALFA